MDKANAKQAAAAAALAERWPGPKSLPPTIWPAQLPVDVTQQLAGLEASGRSMKGRLNIYTCDTCRGHIVTRDLDTGVTPFMTGCKATAECQGSMRSSMYNVFDQTMQASLIWRRPVISDLLKPHVLEHVLRGGLLLREPTQDEKEFC